MPLQPRSKLIRSWWPLEVGPTGEVAFHTPCFLHCGHGVVSPELCNHLPRAGDEAGERSQWGPEETSSELLGLPGSPPTLDSS